MQDLHVTKWKPWVYPAYIWCVYLKKFTQVFSQDEHMRNSMTEHISSITTHVAHEKQMTKRRSAAKPKPHKQLPLTGNDHNRSKLHNWSRLFPLRFFEWKMLLTYITIKCKLKLVLAKSVFCFFFLTPTPHRRKVILVVLTYDPCHQTQNNCDRDKGPVPGVIAAHCCNTQKDEDQRLTDTAPHFQEVLDGGVGFMGYVCLHIRSHHCSTSY